MKRVLVFLATILMMVTTASANDSLFGDEDPLKVYPNPAENFLQVDFSTSQLELPDLKILDLTGKVVKRIDKETMIMEGGVYKSTLDISDLKQGIYFIKLNQGDKVHTKKLVVR